MRIFLLFLIVAILGINISSANEIDMNKVTTIEMADDLRLNIYTKYESSNVHQSYFYSDAFTGYNNYSDIEIMYGDTPTEPTSFFGVTILDRKFKYIYFISPDISQNNSPQKQTAYINISNLNYDTSTDNLKSIHFLVINNTENLKDQDRDVNYILNHELRIESKNNSWFPYYFDVTNEPYIQYMVNNTLILNKIFIDKQSVGFQMFYVGFFKKNFEILDEYKQIIIDNDEIIIDVELNLEPTFLEGNKSILFPIDLGGEVFDDIFVKDVYVIMNNKKMLAQKSKDFLTMTDFAFKSNESSLFYSTGAGCGKNRLMIGLSNIDHSPFKLHYQLVGIINDSEQKKSKDFFTKEIQISGCGYTYIGATCRLEIEIPNGYFFDENSITNKNYLLTYPSANSKKVIWEIGENHTVVSDPFKFSYIQENKKHADKLKYINIIISIMIIVFLFSDFFSLKNEAIISVVGFLAANILIPLSVPLDISDMDKFKIIFMYSLAYLPLLLITISLIHNFYKKR